MTVDMYGSGVLHAEPARPRVRASEGERQGARKRQAKKPEQGQAASDVFTACFRGDEVRASGWMAGHRRTALTAAKITAHAPAS